MARSIAILGGSGFVGRHLIKRLQQDGHTLRVLTRGQGADQPSAAKAVPLLTVDVYDAAALKVALEGCDTAINLTGILNEAGHDGRGFFRVHAQLPASLTQCCRAVGIRRLIHMSALGAERDKPPSDYLRSKAAGLQAVIEQAGDDIDWTMIQPSVIFGPDDSFFMRFAGLLKWLPFFPLACPRARFAPVYVGDVVEAMVRALDKPQTHGRRIECCGPQVMTLHEVVAYTARHSGRRRWILPLNDGLSRLQANVMEYLPGKPFSRDNYLSTRLDSVCQSGSDALNLGDMGIQAQPVDAMMPGALASR